MKLTINGQERQIDARTVRQLIERLGLSQQAVAIELNRLVVPRSRQEQTELADGDMVEVVTLVGGG